VVAVKVAMVLPLHQIQAVLAAQALILILHGRRQLELA
jgi:hypothetical protein